ncbi:MAG TPA: von Willebrand factor type A domain-containing protein [Planctomycetota bacterium]|jgi:Ca-activated chloride channel family protein
MSEPNAPDHDGGHGGPPHRDGHLDYLLTAYLFDSLSSAGRTEVETHLAKCPECREQLSLLRETLALTEKALTDDKEYVFEERRRKRVMEAAYSARGSFWSRTDWSARKWKLGTVAALLMVLVVGGLIFSTARESARRFESAQNLNKIAKGSFQFADVPKSADAQSAAPAPDGRFGGNIDGVHGWADATKSEDAKSEPQPDIATINAVTVNGVAPTIVPPPPPPTNQPAPDSRVYNFTSSGPVAAPVMGNLSVATPEPQKPASDLAGPAAPKPSRPADDKAFKSAAESRRDPLSIRQAPAIAQSAPAATDAPAGLPAGGEKMVPLESKLQLPKPNFEGTPKALFKGKLEGARPEESAADSSRRFGDGKDAKWATADPVGGATSGSFGMDNLNNGAPVRGKVAKDSLEAPRPEEPPADTSRGLGAQAVQPEKKLKTLEVMKEDLRSTGEPTAIGPRGHLVHRNEWQVHRNNLPQAESAATDEEISGDSREKVAIAAKDDTIRRPEELIAKEREDKGKLSEMNDQLAKQNQNLTDKNAKITAQSAVETKRLSDQVEELEELAKDIGGRVEQRDASKFAKSAGEPEKRGGKNFEEAAQQMGEIPDKQEEGRDLQREVHQSADKLKNFKKGVVKQQQAVAVDGEKRSGAEADRNKAEAGLNDEKKLADLPLGRKDRDAILDEATELATLKNARDLKETEREAARKSGKPTVVAAITDIDSKAENAAALESQPDAPVAIEGLTRGRGEERRKSAGTDQSLVMFDGDLDVAGVPGNGRDRAKLPQQAQTGGITVLNGASTYLGVTTVAGGTVAADGKPTGPSGNEANRALHWSHHGTNAAKDGKAEHEEKVPTVAIEPAREFAMPKTPPADSVANTEKQAGQGDLALIDKSFANPEGDSVSPPKAGYTFGVAPKTPPAEPVSKKDSGIIVPPGIIEKAELGDHFETINPEKKERVSRSEYTKQEYTEQNLTNQEIASRMNIPHADYLIYPDDWSEIKKRSEAQAGGGGANGKALEDMVGVGGVRSTNDAFGYRDGIHGGWGGGGQKLGKAALGKASKADAKDAPLASVVELEIYDVRDLSSAITDFPGPRTGLAANEKTAQQSGDEIGRILKERLKADFADPQSSIEEQNGKLVVMNRPEVQQRVREVLGEIRARVAASAAQVASAEKSLRAFQYFRTENPKLSFAEFQRRPGSIPPATLTDEGIDEDLYIEKYGTRPFVDCARDHLSTFSLDVDTASYSLARSRLRAGQLPDPQAVRVEEFVNSFKQPYTVAGDEAFGVFAEAAPSPFVVAPASVPTVEDKFATAGRDAGATQLEILKIGIKSREPRADERKPAMLTFVVDTSGSMIRDERLDLVRSALKSLLAQLNPEDAISIVAFSDQAEVVLPRTQARQKQRILDAIESLFPHGATNVEAGLALGYRMADESFAADAVNRMVLCSDGVANIGAKGPDEMLKLVKVFAGRGIDLCTVGFGMGKYNDAMMVKLADNGNGSCHFVDNEQAAEKVFREQLPAHLDVLARDAKAQIDFNPDVVERYRLLGYEKRKIADKDFRNDKIDAAEIAHSTLITAMYEIKRRPGAHGPLGKVFLRWKDNGYKHLPVIERNYPLSEGILTDAQHTSPNLRFLTCVARFAELLRGSPWVRDSSYADVLRQLDQLPADFRSTPDVQEVRELVQKAQELSVKQWLKEL